MSVTIIMPVSRDYYLKRIFAQLELLECDREKTNLFVYVDGPVEMFNVVRNYVVNSKFAQRLCVYRSKGQPNVGSVIRRRQRIADIHNEIKAELQPTDFIFLIEDDTLLPLNALKKLLDAYNNHPKAGLISGIQIGRWGFDHIGAWRVNDVYDTDIVTSTPLENGVQRVDATGLYCCLTKYENYRDFIFEPFEKALGPDVAFGLHLRKQGLDNYVDFSIRCDHLTKHGSIKFDHDVIQVQLNRQENNIWTTEVYHV